MSGNDLTAFTGETLGQLAPIVLSATTAILMALGVIAGIVTFWAERD